MSIFGMFMLTYPVVPVVPDAVKLNSLFSELNISCEIVELDVTVNTFAPLLFPKAGSMAKFTVAVAKLYSVFATLSALIKKVPEVSDIHIALNLPSLFVLTIDKGSQVLPPSLLLYSWIALFASPILLSEQVPLISTLYPVSMGVLLP